VEFSRKIIPSRRESVPPQFILAEDLRLQFPNEGAFEDAKFRGLARNDWNLEDARKHGFQPLSHRRIQEQLGEKITRAVLFDTPPSEVEVGNHFRALRVDHQAETVTLQPCGIFGNYDLPALPLEVPEDRPTFTGVSIQDYRINGQPTTLAQATQAVADAGGDYPEALEHQGEEILWSDSEGRLQPRSDLNF
jgi:hypothetical protein